MTDASSAPSAATVDPPRTRPSALLLALMLLVVSLLAAWFWFDAGSSRETAPSAAPEAAVVAPTEDPRLERLLTQLADLERVNSVLRQQVVALTERVTVLGEQVSVHGRNLSTQRQDVRGQTSLALAEQWLNLAQARLELFADPAGALQALDAADRALQGSSHPRVPSLRQTLSIERESLRVMPALDTARVAGLLEVWQQALPSWPERPLERADGATDSTQHRFLTTLDRYFRVRPLDVVAHTVVPADVSAISAELAWARVLLARGERAALHVSLQRCAAAIEQRYDTDDASVQAALAGLQDLINALTSSTGTPRLGTSLLELRALESDPASAMPTPGAPALSAPWEDLPEQPEEPAGADVLSLPPEREDAPTIDPDSAGDDGSEVL